MTHLKNTLGMFCALALFAIPCLGQAVVMESQESATLYVDAALGNEIYRDVKAPDAPRDVELMLKGYLANRASRDESFLTFSRRHEVEKLKDMFGAEAPE